MLSQLLSGPLGLQLLAWLVAGIWAVLVTYTQWGQRLDAKRSVIAAAIDRAYHAVESLHAQSPLADKTASALAFLQADLASNKIAVSEQVIAQARVAWEALHGQGKLAAALAALQAGDASASPAVQAAQAAASKAQSVLADVQKHGTAIAQAASTVAAAAQASKSTAAQVQQQLQAALGALSQPPPVPPAPVGQPA